jgi:hypothetical protein
VAAEKRIPLFASGAATKIKAITDKYQLPKYPSFGEAVETIYFQHKDLWSSDKQGSKAHKRSARTIHSATEEYMSVLSRNSTFAELLCTAVEPQGHSRLPIGDINTLTALLKRLLFNSFTAKRATSARGRGKDPLAVTVSTDLGQLYDKWCPPSPRPTPRGESRSHIRASFVHDAARLLGITLTEDSVRTYREKKHKRRIPS